MTQSSYQVVIVGAGIAGSIVAKALGARGVSVCVIEAGPQQPPPTATSGTSAREVYLENFQRSQLKLPEVPYPPLLNDENPAGQATPRPTIQDLFNVERGYYEHPATSEYIFDPSKSYLLQKGPLPFASTYERVAGGTTWHWLGTSLRFLEHDFKTQTLYGHQVDWPDDVYPALTSQYYNMAESEIGVSADRAAQSADLGSIGLNYSADYQYPMKAIPLSMVDQKVAELNGQVFPEFPEATVKVTGTPAGRNSQPYNNRRVCQGNTNCIPICPLQAKYDATTTLKDAQNTGHVTVIPQAVVSKINHGADGKITSVEYIPWTYSGTTQVPDGPKQTVTGQYFVLAAHAIESPKLLLMSNVANSSGLVGKNLMDHPLYLSWSLMPADKRGYGFRGPLATAGIETLRDGAFRSDRAPWRVEIGNEGWNFSASDPWTTTLDMIEGTNNGQANDSMNKLLGDDLALRLNDTFTRQWRMGYLVEQEPSDTSRITLSSSLTDGLGLPRPEIYYDLTDYTKKGFVYAEIFSRRVYHALGARCFTQNPSAMFGAPNPSWFAMKDEWRSIFEALPPELKDPSVTNLPASSNGVPEGFQYFGAGHVVGTCRMGTTRTNSVVDSNQRSWDHDNLYIVGSSTFPTVTTANPTLTIAALAFKTADAITARVPHTPS